MEDTLERPVRPLMLGVELSIPLRVGLPQPLRLPLKENRSIRLGEEYEGEDGAEPGEDHHDPEDPSPTERAHNHAVGIRSE